MQTVKNGLESSPSSRGEHEKIFELPPPSYLVEVCRIPIDCNLSGANEYNS